MTAPALIDDLVGDWLALNSPPGDRWSKLNDAAREDPEAAWCAILNLLERDLTDEQISLLAAGPLEDLLSEHGAAFIDRVEQEVSANKRFDHLLGGVWRLTMIDDVWNRVQKARSAVW
jgi:hypothetical protein